MRITAGQLRGARGLLGISQAGLATEAGVSVETIKRLESMKGVISANPATLMVIEQALGRRGVILIEENGEGPGVRLKKDVAES